VQKSLTITSLTALITVNQIPAENRKKLDRNTLELGLMITNSSN